MYPNVWTPECVPIPNVPIPNVWNPECVPNVPRKIGGQSRMCRSRMYPNKKYGHPECVPHKKYADPECVPNVNGGSPNVPECVDTSFAARPNVCRIKTPRLRMYPNVKSLFRNSLFRHLAPSQYSLSFQEHQRHARRPASSSDGDCSFLDIWLPANSPCPSTHTSDTPAGQRPQQENTWHRSIDRGRRSIDRGRRRSDPGRPYAPQEHPWARESAHRDAIPE
eukprot:gene14934-biopygen12206